MSEQLTNFQDIKELVLSRKTKFYSTIRSRGLDSKSSSFLRGAVSLIGETTLGYDNDETDPEVSDSDLTATFTITTPRKDRYGDVVVPRGCEPHIQNYMKNPQVFFAHKSTEFPIATTSNLVITDGSIRATAKFHEETEEARVVWRFLSKGLLKATSIGFLPVTASLITPEERELDEDDIFFDGWFPLKFKEWDMLEWSVVPVPANPDCVEGLTKYLSDGNIEGEHIPSSIQKSLAPFTLKAKIWSPGFDLGKSKYSGVVLLGQEELEMKEGQVVRLGEVKLVEDEVVQEVPVVVEDVPTEIAIENTFLPQLERILKENTPTPLDLSAVLASIADLKTEFARHHSIEEANLNEILCCVKAMGEKKAEEQVQQQSVKVSEAKALEDAMKSLAKAQSDLKDKFFSMTGKKI